MPIDGMCLHSRVCVCRREPTGTVEGGTAFQGRLRKGHAVKKPLEAADFGGAGAGGGWTRRVRVRDVGATPATLSTPDREPAPADRSVGEQLLEGGSWSRLTHSGGVIGAFREVAGVWADDGEPGVRRPLSRRRWRRRRDRESVPDWNNHRNRLPPDVMVQSKTHGTGGAVLKVHVTARV